ncbi:uncharacterized protein LOC123989002 [Osmia bicornis bicornis]|uniref:uncharacterized protein LOC123989002 n=1 Tax=Osmia bicornis bicornis TaxID=1437191 RepID=UPI001EAF4F57|nr:uncharacterized protein LOC123989002 [Osmia bicornis bicornis]
MSTISGLIERQQELFTSISRTVINLKKKGEANITETYVKARLSILTDNWAAFQHNHATISDQKTEATKKLSYFVDDLRTQCEEMVIENQSILNDYLARFTPAAPTSRSADSHLIAPGERGHKRVAGTAQVTSRNQYGKVQVHQASIAATVCQACQASHFLQSCPTYLAKTLEQRKAFVTQQRLCFNCLGSHHRKSCRSTRRCVTCKARHHSTLHEASKPVVTTTPSKPEQPPSTELVSAPTTSHLAAHHGRMLLATALVKVSSPGGDVCVVRALLDQGSEVSFATESLAQQLSLPRRQANVPVSGIGAGRTVVTRGSSTFKISSLKDPPFDLEVNALILPKLTDYVVDRQLNVAYLPHLHGIQLADPDPSRPRRIDLILGVEVYNAVLLPEVIRGPPHTPIAQRTHLGWIVSGPTSHQPDDASSAAPSSLQCNVDRDLLDLLQRFWAQEEYSTNCESQLSEADLQCEQHFVNTHKRDETGRFIVRLPLSRDVSHLGDSRSSAYRILMSSEHRLSKNQTLCHAYNQFLDEYEQLGHMRRVSPRDIITRSSYYLPHHGVFRDTSSTKIRVVFNGSHKTSSGYSLNDCLHSGPKLQNDLADILLRWRQYAFAFSADVEKMYRQIRVHPDDQALQRILWRRNSSAPVSEFSLTTVTYGLACSPYLALRCMRQLAIDNGNELPLARTILFTETYVDDVLSGAHSIEEGREKVSQICRLLERGGFHLHKWTANSDELISNVSSLVESKSERALNPDTSHRALGLLWNIDRDAFVFSFSASSQSPVTKRTVLSTVSQLFDPLGWIAPVIVHGKILMQELWTLQMG